MRLITNNKKESYSKQFTRRINEPTPSLWNKIGFISGAIAGVGGMLIKPAMSINPIFGLIVSSITALSGALASLSTTMTNKDRIKIFKRKKKKNSEEDQKTKEKNTSVK